MYNNLRHIFDQMGYSPVKLNVEEPHLNVKIVKSDGDMDSEGYAIVTLDETSGTRYSPVQFTHISQQIRNFLMNKDCHLYHFLYIFISDSSSPPFKLENMDGFFWHIIPSRQELLQYGRSSPMYEGLKRTVEEYLQGMGYTRPEDNTASSGAMFREQASPRYPVVNTAIIVINIIIFIITDFITPVLNGSPLMDSGPLSWVLVLEKHQYYRLVTSMFLHAGPDHIFNNMLVLLFIGSYVEQYAGRLRYLVIYFSSGIIAGCTSMVYNMLRHDYTESIGASGAIFGVMGALLCILVIKHNKTHSLDWRRVLFMVFLSLYGGITSQGVDNAAHIGGFLGGLAVTFIITGIGTGRKAGTD